MTPSHLPGPALNPTPGYAHLPVINMHRLDNFLAPRQLAPRHCASAHLPIFMYRDNFSATYKTCTATTPERNKNCTRMAKSTPYLSCHRDNFPAKVPGPVTGWLRQVTQPPFIAGPLCVIR